jgi:hypothetical protein
VILNDNEYSRDRAVGLFPTNRERAGKPASAALWATFLRGAKYQNWVVQTEKLMSVSLNLTMMQAHVTNRGGWRTSQVAARDNAAGKTTQST